MDLLAQRYASPFLILDEFIRLHMVYDFIMQTFNTIAEEKIHDVRWEFWLHRIFDMSFEDYVRRCEEPTIEQSQMDYKKIGSIINESKTLLDGLKG